MTRRLEPMDRVRELGDASVPYRFDVHALVYSDDAVGLDSRLHAALADRRVNKVNQHREFFRTTPAEVRGLLADAAGSHLLEFTETVEALEWRASGATTALAPPPPEAAPSPLPSEDTEDTSEQAENGTPVLQELRAGQHVPLNGVQHLRLLLQIADDADAEIEIDPIAFLLNDKGVVRADSDMVFYGQPDHPSNAVTLAADDTGAPTALHVTPTHVPDELPPAARTPRLGGVSHQEGCPRARSPPS